MNLDLGTKKQFIDFMSNINENDKVALISHTDVDGVVSAYVANRVLNAHVIRFVGYPDLNETLVKSLNHAHVTKIVMTDLFVGNKEFLDALAEFADVLVLDHHLASEDFNAPRISYLKVEDGYCAGYFVYELFSEIQKLEELDWLVACACIADYCHINVREWLSSVYKKYGDFYEEQGRYVRTSGILWDIQETLSLGLLYYSRDVTHVFRALTDRFGELSDLPLHSQAVADERDRLLREFEHTREKFAEGYFYMINPTFPIASLVSTVLSSQEENKIYLVVRPNLKRSIYHVSARRQDKKQDMSVFLKTLLHGLPEARAGGHVPAAGGEFKMDDLDEVKSRLGIKR